jgi:predicted acyltransferase
MNCPKCQKENEANALYCNQCGTPIGKVKKSGIDYSALMLMAYIVIQIVSNLTVNLLKYIGNNYWGDWRMTNIIMTFIYLFINISFLLVPLSIKNLPIKIISFLISMLLVGYWVYGNISFIFEMWNMENSYY